METTNRYRQKERIATVHPLNNAPNSAENEQNASTWSVKHIQRVIKRYINSLKNSESNFNGNNVPKTRIVETVHVDVNENLSLHESTHNEAALRSKRFMIISFNNFNCKNVSNARNVVHVDVDDDDEASQTQRDKSDNEDEDAAVLFHRPGPMHPSSSSDCEHDAL
eukprot:CAMPEP_0202700230 /NCGR_PEP_ID=MMETSP1385-20130828/13430_1 /ASSEMBLY_ACC=CAM_ASM_000861 /TAXON_ID=933848 /ORGANISM="Elphidium margaritaceum" /LENGTH=165 /DNA_ID=CAMNT_0049357367 /DNA_START=763 /DNA_END=1260 /DNA_ORIENTATION=-